MKQQSSFDIPAVAHLAHLTLTPEEQRMMAKQMAETLVSVDILNEFSTSDKKPTSQVTGLHNVTREDVVEPSLSTDDVFKNAQRTHNGYFVVPYVFE